MEDTSQKPKPKSTKYVPPYTLDFSLTDASARQKLVENVLEALQRSGRKPNQKDLDLLSNYLLCGEDPNGYNPVRSKDIELVGYSTPSRPKEQSLEALVESPTFSETLFHQGPTRYTTPKPNLERSAFDPSLGAPSVQNDEPRAIQPSQKSNEKPSPALECMRALWKRIDRLDDALANPGLTSQQTYHLRKLLLELRREQYTIGDFIKPQIQLHSVVQDKYRGGETENGLLWDTDAFPILPMGLYNVRHPQTKFSKPYTINLPDEPLREPKNNCFLDFRNWKHIYWMNEFREDLEDWSVGDAESAIPALYATLDFYTNLAHLRPAQKLIFQLKSQNYTNEFICRVLHEKLGVDYSEPYISTIYTKQICEGIANAAQLHWDTFCARKNPKNFKQCKDCGAVLLMDARNFARSSRNAGGWNCRCKQCEKERRKAQQ